MNRWVGRYLAAAVVGLGALFMFATPAAASAPSASAAASIIAAGDPNDFTFDRLDIDYQLSRSNSGAAQLRVVETFVANFPDFDQNRGMMRALPRYMDRVGLYPRFESVTDEFGTPRPMSIERESNFVTLTSRSDTYLHGQQTFVITYTLQNVVKHFKDENIDEFYWDTTGFETPQQINTLTARISVAPDLQDAATGAAKCYWGKSGSSDECVIQGNAASGWVAEQSPLPPYQNVTVVIGFESKTFAVTEPPTRWTDGLESVHGGLVAFLGATGVGAFVLRKTTLKDSPGHPTVIPQYEPPAGVDALAAATMLGKQATGIPAEILEQATRGSIQLIQGEGKKMVIRLMDPRLAGDRDGAELLSVMFGQAPVPGAEFHMGGAYNARFAKQTLAILARVKQDQVRGGVWRKVRNPLVLIGKILAILIAVVMLVSLPFVGDIYSHAGAGYALAFGGIIAAAIVFMMLQKKPFSSVGAQLRDHLSGLKMFMEWAEADRLRMLQSVQGAERARVDINDPRQRLLIYEPLLPYAVVFGIEKSWAKELEVLFRETNTQPSWAGGPYGFSVSLVSQTSSSVSTTTIDPSSSSSGSGGGGFSGGGGGGGRIGGV